MREASVPVIRRGPIGKSVTGEGTFQGVKNSLSKGLSVQVGRGRDVAKQITNLGLPARVSGGKDVARDFTSQDVTASFGGVVGGNDVPLATISGSLSNRDVSRGSVSLSTQVRVGKKIRVLRDKFRSSQSTRTSSSRSA